MNVRRKRIVFLTGTRADFGKLKPLMRILVEQGNFDIHIFITGMHMLSRYGYTCAEVEKSGFENLYKFINQNASDSMDHVLSKTITGLSDYVKEICPDLLIVHGDRVEALAGATVGMLNNILVGHIEGGEVSGTVDEVIRHSVTKMSHIHFVANDAARVRLMQLGEQESCIHVIGSPDIDIMNSESLPSLEKVKERYGITFPDYSILMFHPVTTEVHDLHRQIRILVDQVLVSGKNYVVIYPNNDLGTEIILDEYERLKGNPRFVIFPSMRFEFFLTLMKNSDFVIGNSSAGVREAPHYGVPTINLGTRQHNRVECASVLNCSIDEDEIARAISSAEDLSFDPQSLFGIGDSADQFLEVLSGEKIWDTEKQKHFIDFP